MKILLPMAIIICGLFAAVKSTFAQTWTQSTNAPSTYWTSMASSADGRKLIALGGSWSYYISTNSGTMWVSNSEPQRGSDHGSWSSVVSSADGTKLVGVNGNAIWISTNSGTTWSSNTVPNVSF